MLATYKALSEGTTEEELDGPLDWGSKDILASIVACRDISLMYHELRTRNVTGIARQ